MPVGRFYHCAFKDSGDCPTLEDASPEFCKSCGTWRPNFNLVNPNRDRYEGYNSLHRKEIGDEE